MAYTKGWDESAPSGNLPANQLDTALQETKTALRERLEQIIPHFANDAFDPKRVVAVYSGTLQNRPAVQHGGVVYVATDENKVYYSLPSGSWRAWPSEAGLTMLRGTAAGLPSPAAHDFYYATDTKDLYVRNLADPPQFDLATPDAPASTTTAGPNTATIKRAGYSGGAAAGSRVSGYGDALRVLAVLFSGTTDTNGFIILDIKEFNVVKGTEEPAGDYLAGNIFSLHTERAMLGASTYPTNAQVGTIETDTTNNTIRFQILTEAGAAVTNTSITVHITMFFGA